MLTSAKTILCYGDSNTHGQIPATYRRYPANIRWTGILQELMGDSYYVIEEGMGGRTVDLDEPDSPGRNGYDYFLPCLSSHQPLDFVIIMLGTNDLKVRFDRSAADAVQGLGKYIEAVKKYKARVLLVSPLILNPESPEWSFYGENCFDEESARKSKEFVGELGNLANEKGCDFMAASTVVEPGVDGIHMDEVAHKAFAEAIAANLRLK